MNILSELFGDEISDLKQHAKVSSLALDNDEFFQSEEEIKQYSTNEDMGEMKRSVFLLKKGYQSQKITVIQGS